MDDDQQFCLRWNNHQSTLISVFDTLLENGTLVDCTLAAEGKFLKAHKVVLSACSPYFASLLSQQYDKHPIFILKDVKFQELRAMMDYMYRGEVNISQDQLAALLKAAESLQIKGLSDSRSGGTASGSGGGGGGGGSSGGNNAGQKQPTNEHKQMPVPASVIGKGGSSSGYTLEQKRSRHAMGGSSIESQELSGSREGSSSPTSRKRKKMRRRSLDNIMADNHEHSNSSSHSLHVNSSVPPSNTSTAIPPVPTIVATSSSSLPTTSISAAVSGGSVAGLNVTKKTEIVSNTTKLEGMEHDMDNDNEDDDDDNQDENEKPSGHGKKEQNHKRNKSQHIDTDNGKDNMLIEPKSEYDDGNDENVEDLTLDEEELLDDLEQAGPSHGGGEGSSQEYAQWQVDRSQDEVFMPAQEAAGQQRDPQGYWTILEAVPVTMETIRKTDCTTTGTIIGDTNVPETTNIVGGATVMVHIPGNLSTIDTSNSIDNSLTIESDYQKNTITNDLQNDTYIDNVQHEIILKSEQHEYLKNSYDNLNNYNTRSEYIQNRFAKSSRKMKNKINKSLQYTCDKCGKSYKIKGSLKRHQNYECGVTPMLSCKFCLHKSTYKSDLRKHMLQKHNDQSSDFSDMMFN